MACGLLTVPAMNAVAAGQSLTLDDIVHRYGSGAFAVDHVTLEIGRASCRERV